MGNLFSSKAFNFSLWCKKHTPLNPYKTRMSKILKQIRLSPPQWQWIKLYEDGTLLHPQQQDNNHVKKFQYLTLPRPSIFMPLLAKWRRSWFGCKIAEDKIYLTIATEGNPHHLTCPVLSSGERRTGHVASRRQNPPAKTNPPT